MKSLRKYGPLKALIIFVYWVLQRIPYIKKVMWYRTFESFHRFLYPKNPYLWGAIGDNVVISRKAEIFNSRGIELDDGVWIEDHAVISAEGGRIRFGKYTHVLPYGIVKAMSGDIKFGEYCTINPFCVIYGLFGGLQIGNAVRIATQTVIVPGDHMFDDFHKQIRLQGIKSVGIKIEDDVWIGAGARILDGVTIGKGAVVSAGTVVNKDIPEFAVVGGVPARILKWRNQ